MGDLDVFARNCLICLVNLAGLSRGMRVVTVFGGERAKSQSYFAPVEGFRRKVGFIRGSPLAGQKTPLSLYTLLLIIIIIISMKVGGFAVCNSTFAG